MLIAVCDWWQDIEREFPLALDLGCGSGHLYKQLSVDDKLGGIEKLVQCDVAGTSVSRSGSGGTSWCLTSCCWFAGCREIASS